MPEDGPARPRRRRLWLALGASVLLLAAVAALALRHYLQPERLLAWLGQQARSTLGAELTSHGEAHFGFMPKLHLRLPGAELKMPAGARFLGAESVDVRVPWRNVWAERYEIERIDLQKPVLDLDAFSAWLASRPPSEARAPDVRFALHIADGTVMQGGKPVAEGVNAELANGDDLAAWLEAVRANPAAARLPPLLGRAQLSTLRVGDSVLEGVQIEAGESKTPPPAKQL
jgi:hypothetical protein